MKKAVYLLVLIFVATAAFLLGSFFTKKSLKNQGAVVIKNTEVVSNKVQDIRESGYKYINPLLDCDQNEVDFTELKSFKKSIQTLVDKEKQTGNASSVSVYYRDMNNGPWFSINKEANYIPASLLKVPLMIAYYKLSESNPKILEEKIKIDNLKQLVPNQQFIEPSKQIEVGKLYSVSELIEQMIRYSDNNAAQILIEHINPTDLEKVYSDFNLNIPTVSQPEVNISVDKEGSFFRLLFNGSYLSQADSEKAMEALVNVDFKDGLVAGVPDDVKVAHKFGERIADNQLTQLHDCGIIYYPKRPYLLCVMTQGGNEQKLASTIKDISGAVYKEVDVQLNSN